MCGVCVLISAGVGEAFGEQLTIVSRGSAAVSQNSCSWVEGRRNGDNGGGFILGFIVFLHFKITRFDSFGDCRAGEKTEGDLFSRGGINQIGGESRPQPHPHGMGKGSARRSRQETACGREPFPTIAERCARDRFVAVPGVILRRSVLRTAPKGRISSLKNA